MMQSKKFYLALMGLMILVGSVCAQQAADPKWTGQVNAGWTSTSGNTKSSNISLGISAERRTEKDRITLGSDYAKGKVNDVVNEEWWRSNAKYDYFINKVWYGFVNGRYETDDIANLDSRTVLGAGAGRQLIETKRTNLSCELGMANINEKYSTNKSNSEVTAQASYKLTHQIIDTVQLVHDLSYYPSTSDFADYYLTSTLELRANFTKTMFANFKAIYSRDASPAAGQANSDIKYIVGIGMGF